MYMGSHIENLASAEYQSGGQIVSAEYELGSSMYICRICFGGYIVVGR